MIDENHPDFFRILGYLASNSRHTKLDIETIPQFQNSVEKEYENLTGMKLLQDDHNYYVWPAGTNKWAPELRIYFIKNDSIPPSLSTIVRSARFESGEYNARINNNEFVWKLIKYGFRIGDTQDTSLIESKVPSIKLNDFKNGLKL
jgi:hypothetical protein